MLVAGSAAASCSHVLLRRNVPEDRALQEQWNALVQEMEHPQVFFTYEWALAVERAYFGSFEPWLLLQYDGTVLTGVAALAIDRNSLRATFLTATTADYCDFVSHPSARAALIEATFTELRREKINEIVLTNLPSDSASVNVLQSLSRKYRYRTFFRTAYLCSQVHMDAQGREVMKAAICKKKTYRYGMNALAKQGGVSVVHRKTWRGIEPALPHFFACHLERSEATGRLNCVSDRQRKTFLIELAKLLSEQGWMALSMLRVGDRDIAWNYGFQFNDTWFWYQPTLDADFEKFSPGHLLLSKIIGEASDLACFRIVDLGLGAEGYKERFANARRKTLHATITSSVSRYLLEIARYRTAGVVKSSPKLEKRVRLALQHLRSLRAVLRKWQSVPQKA